MQHWLALHRSPAAPRCPYQAAERAQLCSNKKLDTKCVLHLSLSMTRRAYALAQAGRNASSSARKRAGTSSRSACQQRLVSKKVQGNLAHGGSTKDQSDGHDPTSRDTRS